LASKNTTTPKKRRRGVPPASSLDAYKRMTTTRQRDTVPERLLRAELHRRGLRFRIHRKLLPELRRQVDVAFGPARVAVFVDGCFWHSCPIHRTSAKANAAFWRQKLADNVCRDRDTDARLRKAGWRVVRVWEHEAPERAAAKIAKIVDHRLRGV
jgi:DNA mismatch endonuclease (patch repair protein)